MLMRLHTQAAILLAATVLLAIIVAGCGTATFSAENTPIAPEPTNTPMAVSTLAPNCNRPGQHVLIDEAFERYQAERTNSADPVAQLRGWTGGVSAEIAANCRSDIFTTGARDELRNMLSELQNGGYIVYVRHTHTDRTRRDTDTSLGQCDQQRILSDQGREEALMIRYAYQRLNLPVSSLVSTQYCRTLETAVLAFGVPEVIQRRDLHATLTDRLAEQPAAGTNTLIVAHIGTLRDGVGLPDTFDEGDSLIYRPTGDGEFVYFGRIGLYDWPILAGLAAE